VGVYADVEREFLMFCSTLRALHCHALNQLNARLADAEDRRHLADLLANDYWGSSDLTFRFAKYDFAESVAAPAPPTSITIQHATKTIDICLTRMCHYLSANSPPEALFFLLCLTKIDFGSHQAEIIVERNEQLRQMLACTDLNRRVTMEQEEEEE
jgi:hypothetical protein